MQGRAAGYLDLAAALRPRLERIDGFLSVVRFQSLADPDMLSLSFWRDEAAVRAWRNTAEHRATQGESRAGVFAEYRLRIAEVVRDYGMHDRCEAPADSRATHGGRRIELGEGRSKGRSPRACLDRRNRRR